ncbi:TolC family protein [bacterium]|nr:TolC family protein [bacterium]
MKKILLIFFIVFFLFIERHAAYSQDVSARDISLKGFIKEAYANDTVFQKILIDQLNLKYQKALKIPAGDLVLSVASQYNAYLDIDESEVDNSLSLSKLFPYLGTAITADYTSSDPSSSTPVTSEIDAYISQPIAENAFGRDTRLLSKIIGVETEVAKHQIVEAYEDYLATLIQTYLDWFSAYKNVETAQNSYNENMKLLENIKQRQSSHIALAIDVNKVKLQVLVKKENLISLENQYEQYLNIVKQAMRYKEEARLSPQDPCDYDNIAVDFNDGYARFCRESRTYQVLSLLGEKSLLQVDRDADKLLPSIELKIGYLVEGEEYDLRQDTRTAYGKVEVEWPIIGQKERAQHKLSKIALRKQQLSNQGTYAGLRTKLKNIYDAIVREKELITIADKKIRLAEDIVRDETRNYSYGKVTLNDFIDQINELEDNKFNKINHIIQLRKLIIEWMRLTDNLITKDEAKELNN